jgi:hypothetical protein
MSKKTGRKIWNSLSIILAFLIIFAGVPQSKVQEQSSTFTFEDLAFCFR